MPHSLQVVQRTTAIGLGAAVHRSKALSHDGILERLFTLAFCGLVYPRILEDPVVDMEALNLSPCDRIITIASGGCNALSYLVANPAKITAVDLNGAHVALNRLKLAVRAGDEARRMFFTRSRPRELRNPIYGGPTGP